jgi:non-canonical purine NTP pyrophosphatase (RdgB/HAM1 family)
VTELLVATTNDGKLAEIKDFLIKLPLKIVSLKDLGRYPEVIEDGATFEQNALKKARTLARYSGLWTTADDSGLQVDALNGAPGIYSARYSGPEADDRRNNEKLLSELNDIPWERRGAAFVCALALCHPDGIKEWTITEQCEGKIAFTPRGENGFGYDPLFFYPPFGKTFGEIGRDVKATVSHRGKALKKLTAFLATQVLTKS